MASVCFYFQIHQPFRLRRYSVFRSDPFYFDSDSNQAIMEKVADKCYRPATTLMLDLIKRHEGRFKISFSISGTAIEQMKSWAPDVIDLLQQCAATGCADFLAETSHHSLTALYAPAEFAAQVDSHVSLMRDLFDIEPVVFRNTELIYSDRISELVAGTERFKGMLAEGVDRLLGDRSPAYPYVLQEVAITYHPRRSVYY
jgi:alpha-amylase